MLSVPARTTSPQSFGKTICRAETASRPDPAWNLLKIHTEQFAVTFLSYPDFDSDPHPALAEATKINVNTGSIVRTDYRARAESTNPAPKETFLPPDDPRIPGFAALTKREEEAGLYRDPSTDRPSRPMADAAQAFGARAMRAMR